MSENSVMTESVKPSTTSTMISLEVLRNQEAIFAIFMGVIAFLFRQNPDLQYPEALWAFGIFFLFNLGYHKFLNRHNKEWIVPFISIAVNSLIITFVLSTSGGARSYFWPMYLLPIFTACMYLEVRHIAIAVLIPAAFLGYFYLEYLYNGEEWKLAELAIKWSVLALAAGVTMRESFRRRQTINALYQSRAELDQIVHSQEHELKMMQLEKNVSTEQAVRRLLEEMHIPLSMIWASTQILLQDADPAVSPLSDLRRIQTAIGSCYDLIAQSKKWIQADGKSSDEVNIEEVINQLVTMFGYQVNRKQMKVLREMEPHLPQIHASYESVFQVLLGVFLAMTDLADNHGTLRLGVHGTEGGVNIRFTCENPILGVRFKGLESSEELVSSRGGTISVQKTDKAVVCSIFLPIEPSEKSPDKPRSRH